MIPGFVIAQLADLASFLVAVIAYPALIEHEVGLIGGIYAQWGVFGALVWKGGLILCVIWLLNSAKLVHPTATNAVAGIGIAFGVIGAVFNTFALWSLAVGA